MTVATPLSRDVTDWDEYVGRFEAIESSAVRPRVSGTITRILFKNGEDVRAGQALFVVDPRPYRADYLKAVAATGRSQATLTNAQTELARAQKLRDVKAVSQEELETKLANVRTAQADLNANRAAQAVAKLNLDFTTVRAAVSGRVSDKKVSLGDVVVAQQTDLTSVVTMDPIWFSFEGAESLYLKYVRQAATGERGSSRNTPNPVDIQLADENSYTHHGKMVFIDNNIDPKSGTIRAHAELSNHDRMLTPGMFGRARLLGSGSYRAMLIPDEAITTDQTRKLVYVVDDKGLANPHEVETGPMVAGLRVIRKGLGPNDKVVLDGLAQLQPGAAVDPQMTKLQPRAADTAPGTVLTAPPAAAATAH